MVTAAPSPERIALNRMGFGARPGDEEYLRAVGLATHIEQQLHPTVEDDPPTQARLGEATLAISYGASAGKYPAVAENRRLVLLGRSIEELWAIQAQVGAGTLPQAEVTRALEELRAATWIRATHSTWQLREVMAGFWHDHFNVNGTADNRITVAMPVYDRDVIRAHALGNFRQLLEAVATSTAMLLYLDNAKSQAARPNENYARESMELHSLGRDAYLGHAYAHWSHVPRLGNGMPVGFLDEDVFGAARAFSGWTVAMGQRLSGAATLDNDGAFAYAPQYHSNAAARVLGVDLSPLTQPMAAGRKVLDLMAAHPATARFVAAKLAQRLIGPGASAGLIERAAATFTASAEASDQIARTLRTLLLDPEFVALPAAKLRRPFERIVALLRATGAELRPTAALFRALEETGQRPFAWPAPNGHPDVESAWLGANQELKTWNLMLALFEARMGVSAALLPQTPSGFSVDTPIAVWCDRLLGHLPAAAGFQALMDDAVVAGGLRAALIAKGAVAEAGLRRFVALLAATDDFAYR